MDHEIRKAILLKLIHAPRAAYGQLWDRNVESAKFAYHLKQLEEEGLVQKYDDGYGLTPEGRKHSAFIEGDTGVRAELPTPIVVILARKGDTLLYQKRLKEPFYGVWGPISGKVNFGWNPKECAIRDLKEESGLDAHQMEFRAIQFIKTYEGERLLHHHLLYVFETSEFSGELIARTHKAMNEFITLAEAKSRQRFPLDFMFTDMPATENFFIVESERFMENGKFVDGKILSVQELGFKAPTAGRR
jgi:ADP-ribose pyrophosphatase YjhB (NUDIX family)